ncbi:hypothetical protein D3C78_1474900 [compost metagenome]
MRRVIGRFLFNLLNVNVQALACRRKRSIIPRFSRLTRRIRWQASSYRGHVKLQTLHPGFRHLRILLGLDPGHPDRTDHLAVDRDRHPAFQ